MSALLLFLCLTLSSLTDFGASVNPGVYFLNLTSSISNGTSAPFVVYSTTGLNVNVDNSSLIYNNSIVNLTWIPFAGSAFNATAKIEYLNIPGLDFNNVTLPDTGSAFVNLTSFGVYLPGYYNISVYNELGFGVSNIFIVSSTTSLNVSVNATSIPAESNATLSWTPVNLLGSVNISLIRLSNGFITPVFTDIPDVGTALVDLSYPPGAYQLVVNSSIGNGISPVIDITTTSNAINVAATPSNISAVDGISNITWTPFDPYQTTVDISIYSGFILIATFSVQNNGSYNLSVSSYGLAPSPYTINVTSAIGSGNTTLTLYSASGLNVSVPNPASVIYNDSTFTPVQWTPVDFGATNASIILLNQNDFQNYTVSAQNYGFAGLDLVALGVPAGTYNLSVDSSLGYGQTDMFVIRYSQFFNISSPNATTNISDVGLLDMDWLPTNPAGGNATIYLYQPANASILYGPFSTADDGDAIIDLATAIISKNLLPGNDFVEKNVLAAKEYVVAGFLSPKKMKNAE